MSSMLLCIINVRMCVQYSNSGSRPQASPSCKRINWELPKATCLPTGFILYTLFLFLLVFLSCETALLSLYANSLCAICTCATRTYAIHVFIIDRHNSSYSRFLIGTTLDVPVYVKLLNWMEKKNHFFNVKSV